MSRPLSRSRNAAVLMASALMCVFVTTGPASAHADLVGSTPESSSRVAAPPDEVALRFNEAVDPQLATVVVTVHDQEPQRVPTRLGDEQAVLLAEVPAGMVGTGPWRVDYRVTSVDGHPIQGTLEFVVDKPAQASANETRGSASGSDESESNGADEPVAPAQDADASLPGGGAPAWLILLIAVVMLSPVVAILAWSLWRHRRTVRTGDGGV